MKKSSGKSTPKANEPVRLKPEQLLMSKRFEKYQIDFARVVLGNKTYTPREAESVLDRYFHINKEEK